MRFLKRSGSSLKLPTLRFRGKIMLGFAVVLAISAASMGFAYLGFENVSAGVDSYRHSVQEAEARRSDQAAFRDWPAAEPGLKVPFTLLAGTV